MNSLAASLLSALILTTVFTVMWRNHRERWLGLWAIAAALWATRYLLALFAGGTLYGPGAQLLPLLAIGRGYFLLAGSYALERRPLPRPWALVFLALTLSVVAAPLAGEIILAGVRGVPVYVAFGLATLWSARIVVRSRGTLGDEAFLVAGGLATLGAVNLTFPWTSQMSAVRPTFFMVAHASQLLVGFGALMLFYSRASAERDVAQARLEAALEKALSGYLPICAHCKAIEGEDGSWEPLERYVTRRTDAAFSHGVCPPCFERHYEHLPEPDSARPGIAA